MGWKSIAATFLVGASLLFLPPPSVANEGTASMVYRDPDFAPQCRWHHFGEGEKPPWWLFAESPLCVEYSKRDITFDNGGAEAFLLAEPTRIAVAIPSCRYWQVDHWSVQHTAGSVPYVAWNGSYWFDKARGKAAILLRDFRIHGATAGVGDVAIALRPQYPLLADALARYGDEYGESGFAVDIPSGWWC
ncbi:hypothetical protein [Actinokineospora sp. HUAS TT18]|uniref:hypothetical protein n=1 Tax=Actinokineospora sp. HUAS TT18 TaxID=3447451 RepID=UPI003F51F378